MPKFEVQLGSNKTLLKALPDNSIDSIVTDPPYELNFVGKKWDASGIAYDEAMWAEALRVLKPGGHLLAFSGSRTYHRMVCAIEDAGFDIRDQIMWVYSTGMPKSLNVDKALSKNGQDGSKWEGWGTALKPSHEPICVARKPLEGTVAANVLAFGTGALNIDASRVGTEGGTRLTLVTDKGNGIFEGGINTGAFGEVVPGLGRWPANFIHDGLEHEDWSKYFYCAKASNKDRGDDNIHPTVKPNALMRYLVRLVTPPGGKVLDIFNGSGSTGVAAVQEGFDYLGMELTPEYVPISQKRIQDAIDNPDTPEAPKKKEKVVEKVVDLFAA